VPATFETGSLDILINNAGIMLPDPPEDDLAALERHLAVHLFGTQAVTQAFLPALIRSRGAVINILSVMALAPLPPFPSYGISKAAAFSLTQSLRAVLAGQGVTVHAVLAGPVDTDMTRSRDIPKASPESVARAIFDAVDNGEEDIFPDPASAPWRIAGAAARPRYSSASLHNLHNQRPSHHEQAETASPDAGPAGGVAAGAGRTGTDMGAGFGPCRGDANDPPVPQRTPGPFRNWTP
jgi:NAD(P)-dependent dehydrogenase (short-subunit alcohol dehydrogenase family)